MLSITPAYLKQSFSQSLIYVIIAYVCVIFRALVNSLRGEKMSKFIFTIIIASLCLAGCAVTGDEPGEDHRNWKAYTMTMRDLDREYQSGALTKTEYIQRKRELDALYQ